MAVFVHHSTTARCCLSTLKPSRFKCPGNKSREKKNILTTGARAPCQWNDNDVARAAYLWRMLFFISITLIRLMYSYKKCLTNSWLFNKIIDIIPRFECFRFPALPHVRLRGLQIFYLWYQCTGNTSPLSLERKVFSSAI